MSCWQARDQKALRQAEVVADQFRNLKADKSKELESLLRQVMAHPDLGEWFLFTTQY